ncbi:BrnA antitoxin family protein [Ciceribacter sp. L1K22]|uniref:BrnA antitoxin family protein n=1 Tax=Ciceribacter sp. L1K22 TaxID=2820275 RepID=UPI001ABE9963|nr:BrnA antitoxin family protein [Ciceribacter sp. L1K22]MBO3761083.1 BrnA antitoxin family protein [Ciceribacter sp. L1K22]
MATKNKTLKTFEDGRGYDRADWDAVDAPELSDEELARMRPAKEVLPPAFFEAMDDHRRARGRPAVANPKKQITLRLDEDVIEKFRETGKGWQGRVNAALRKAVGI